MCLSLDNQFAEAPAPKSPIKVYKWYERPFGTRAKYTVTSPYQCVEYKLRAGQFIQSSRKSPILTMREQDSGIVKEGFHCFTSLKSVTEDKFPISMDEEIVVAAFWGHPEDFVSYGSFIDLRSVVFTRLQFINFIE